ncbi:MAG: hypothetical protein IJ716_07780 [Lachnospiraceae bacterium]|nr:hypothetical protein [Lachnospiraceae bacterium]
MNLRTIMIFPEFENQGVLEQIRDKYDPLAKLVRPHITIVFPFASEMSNMELISSFEISLQGFCKHRDQFGNYLFLNVIKGAEQIIKIHDVLYKNDIR